MHPPAAGGSGPPPEIRNHTQQQTWVSRMSDWTAPSSCPWKRCRRRPHSLLHCPTERCTEAGLCPNLHADKHVVCKWTARMISRQFAAHCLRQCCVLPAKLRMHFHMPMSLLGSRTVTCKVPVACSSEGFSIQPGLMPRALSKQNPTMDAVRGRC